MKKRSAALIEKFLANDASGGMMFCAKKEMKLVNKEPFRAALAYARGSMVEAAA